MDMSMLTNVETRAVGEAVNALQAAVLRTGILDTTHDQLRRARGGAVQHLAMFKPPERS